ETTGGGVLVEPDDSDALSRGILDVYEHPGRRHELAESAYHGVRKHYNVSQMARKTVEVFQTVLEGKAV
ncbi:MAG: hypothetical protein P8Z37_19380, partial [Acidobacteriota bacterium]